MISIIWHALAEEELLSTIDYYEIQCRGLGQTFLTHIELALSDISDFPNMWPLLKGQIRHRIITQFPYSIIYRIHGETIIILAVMHMHRKPNYWNKH